MNLLHKLKSWWLILIGYEKVGEIDETPPPIPDIPRLPEEQKPKARIKPKAKRRDMHTSLLNLLNSLHISFELLTRKAHGASFTHKKTRVALKRLGVYVPYSRQIPEFKHELKVNLKA